MSEKTSERLTRFFASRWGIIIAGAAIGLLAPLLQKLGNPANMGICVACFERDIAGALGLHRAAVVQYIRPEIIGFVLGSLIAALLFREFKARGGSAPIVRYVLGVFAMIGALAFLGCPWRALLRLAGPASRASAVRRAARAPRRSRSPGGRPRRLPWTPRPRPWRWPGKRRSCAHS